MIFTSALLVTQLQVDGQLAKQQAIIEQSDEYNRDTALPGSVCPY